MGTASTKKFIKNNAGVLTEATALTTSAGAADADRIPALDAAGRLDQTMMPVGVAADVSEIEAGEALAAGDFVNVYDDTGTPKVRKADATTAGKEAHGFVIAAFASGATASVYHEGPNDQLTGLTAGQTLFISAATPGGVTATAPSASGNVVQRVGVAVSATKINFEHTQPIVLA